MDAATVPLRAEWLHYWAQYITIASNGGHLALPLRGLVYRLDKDRHAIHLVACLRGARTGNDAILNRRCFQTLGWAIVEADDCEKTPEQFAMILTTLSESGVSVVDKNLLSRLEALEQSWRGN